jgi:Skp family chaperone for outer membrane proteins
LSLEGDIVNKTSVITVLAVSLLAATSVSLADAQRGPRDPGVNVRQEHQRDRIQQGVRSGELTRRESIRLREEQRDIRQLERAYKSDGVLTGAERRDLHQEQNQASRHVYNQKHDAQERPKP